MKTYEITRTEAGVKVDVRPATRMKYKLPTYNNVFNHSPDGFEYGYGGSGPAQLALAILVDHLKDRDNGTELAIRLHQTFKWRYVASVPQEVKRWSITSTILDDFLVEEGVDAVHNA